MTKLKESTQFDSADYHIYKCWCGEHSYLEVSVDKEDGDVYFTISIWPTSLWDRIRMAWKALRGIEFESSNSVMMSKEDFKMFLSMFNKDKRNG